MENKQEEKIERIFVEKNESAVEVLEKILSSKDNDIVLVIPKDSILKKSPANFHLIKHEAEVSKKKILIESVDSDVLNIAKSFQLEAIHPLLDKHPVTDMKEEFFAENVEVKDKPENVERHLKIKKHFKKFPKFSFSRKSFVYLVIIILVLVGGFFIVNKYLPKATITLTLVKNNWSYQGNFSGSTSSLLASSSLPIQIFSQSTNKTGFFPASSNQKVYNKATGVITVYNDYSTAIQPLVKGTRFETPDGKIFRTNYEIIVPGAKNVNGKLIPSSIDVGVTADQAGASYNIGPVAKFTIPGFKGTPRYNGFYGSSSKAMTGGFIGEIKVPTKNDIELAEASTTQALLSNSSSLLFSNIIPSGFKVLDGASTTTITKLVVTTSTDSQGNFSVFVEVKYEAMAFKEDDINSLLQSIWQQKYPNTIAQNLNISYQNVQADFKNGKLSFSLTASAELVSNISAADVKNQILGKSEQELKNIITNLPGVEKAEVSLWPFWVTSVPSQPSRVEVNLN